MSEVRKAVQGFEGRYEVSGLGRVRSLPRKNCPNLLILKLRLHKQGYLSVVLYDGNGRATSHFVHRLVCAAFNGDAPIDKLDVNHIDGVKGHNDATNLEWTNDSLNVTHAFRVLGAKHAINKPWLGKYGAANPKSKPVIRTASDGTSQRFAGISDAARAASLNFKHISACCLGKRKTHGGFQWRFEENDLNVIRQGDVALIRVKEIPVGAVEQPTEGPIVLAFGEVTFHKHAFYDDAYNVKLYVAGGARYLDIVAPVELKHEEHSTARIPAGKWLLPQQVEYTPAELRRVVD